MKNEKTSKAVAKIASEVLRRCGMCKDGTAAVWLISDSSVVNGKILFIDCITVAELKSLAASALTQAPDQKGEK